MLLITPQLAYPHPAKKELRAQAQPRSSHLVQSCLYLEVEILSTAHKPRAFGKVISLNNQTQNSIVLTQTTRGTYRRNFSPLGFRRLRLLWQTLRATPFVLN